MDPASGDPARTYALRLAGESLGRLASDGQARTILLQHRSDGKRFELYARRGGVLSGRPVS